jgi:hypothetical protein
VDIPSLIRAAFSSLRDRLRNVFLLTIVRNLCSKLPQMIGKLEGKPKLSLLMGDSVWA